MTSSGMGFLIYKISNDINSIPTSQQPFNMINLSEKIKNINTYDKQISDPRKIKRDNSITNFMKFSWSWSM